MTEKLRRRDLVKTVAAAGGLLVLGSAASAAEPDKTSKLPGESHWLLFSPLGSWGATKPAVGSLSG